MNPHPPSDPAAEAVRALREPWIVRQGERFPAWFAEGAKAMANVKFVPVERHKVRAFVITNAEVDAFNAKGKSNG